MRGSRVGKRVLLILPQFPQSLNWEHPAVLQAWSIPWVADSRRVLLIPPQFPQSLHWGESTCRHRVSHG